MVLSIFDGIINLIKEVSISLLPLVIVFIFIQILSLRLAKSELIKIIHGIILTFIGLVLFFHGITISFIDTGYEIGNALGLLTNTWLIIPIGFVLGFIITLAEPAVRILNNEIENVTTGYISKKIVLYFLSIGVACSVSLSMLRILTGISLWYIIIPGYILALILMKYVTPLFIAIAFDAGGVVTGPMIATSILAITIGISQTIEGSNPLIEGFGMIALVSLMPILSVLILGLLYKRSGRGGLINESN